MKNMMSSKHGAGKGSRFRPVDQKKYDENWEKCFGKKKAKKRQTKKTQGDKNERSENY